MKLSPKQRAKRRWKTQRDAKAKIGRAFHNWFHRTTKRHKTPFGVVTFRTHPLFATTDKETARAYAEKPIDQPQAPR